MRPVALASALALVACSSRETAPVAAADAGALDDTAVTCPPALATPRPRPTTRPTYPLDDVLRVNHLQAEATHNSYHLRPEAADLPDWDYEHAPLATQLGAQGVRGIELDVRWNEDCARFEVYHLPQFDDRTSCRLFTECLQQVRDWSDANPGHHVLFVQLEAKGGFDRGAEEERMTAVEREILSVFPRDAIVAPDDVKGDAATLREAIVMRGWPTLGATRGKVLFYLDDSGPVRDAYTHGKKDLDGRLIFADGDEADPFAAVLVLNDALGKRARVEAAVKQGFLVRVFAASRDGVYSGDRTELDAALASGAQILSSDWPAMVPGAKLFVEVTGGTPSRCNPLVAPAECTAAAIESPDRLR